MNDQEIDALLAATAVRDDHIASLPLGGLVTELRERTMTITDPVSTEERVTPIPLEPIRRRRILPRLALAAAAFAVVAGVVAANTGGSDIPGGPGATTDGQMALPYSAELVAFAESSPRLLLRADGWQVTRVEEPEEDGGWGEMRFGLHGAVFGGPGSPGGENTLELTWRPVGTAEDPVADPENFEQLGDVTVAGQPVGLFRSRGVDTYRARWLQGDLAVELRGDRITEAAFRDLVMTIEAVDVNTWLAAFPESFLRPDEHAAAIAELRIGIPAPAGFDASVWDGVGVTDRTALGARVTGAIACAWIEQYEAGVTAGDAAVEQEARDALAGSRDWPALREMAGESHFPMVLWEIADRIVSTGVVGPRGGPDVEGYANTLCLPG